MSGLLRREIDSKKKASSVGVGPLVPLSSSTIQVLLSVVMVSVALPSIKQTLYLNASDTAWIITSYYLPLIVLAPVAGYLADAIGTRLVLLLGFVLHFMGSIISGLFANYTFLIIGRLLQGSGSAALIALPLGIVASLYPLEERGLSLTKMYLAAPVGSLIGPGLAGFLVENVGWGAVFWALSCVGMINILLAWIFLPKREQSSSLTRSFDWRRATILCVGLTSILILFINPRLDEMSSLIKAILLTISFLALLKFAFIERRRVTPFFDRTLFKRPEFSAVTISMAIRMFVFSAVQFVFPLFMSDVLGYSATRIGLIFIVQPLAQLLGILISGHISDIYGPILPSIAAFIMMFGSLTLPVLLVQMPSQLLIIIVLGLVMTPKTWTPQYCGVDLLGT